MIEEQILINIQNLEVRFGHRTALTELSLSFRRGTRAALLGPNGAGKSTLMQVVCGVLEPEQGTVEVAGLSAAEARRWPGFLGWLPERAPLNPELTAREHLELAGRFRALSAAETAAEIDRLATALALGEKLDRLAGGLSLGSRRQAALAVALLGRPRLVVLDEPSSSLDPEQIWRLRRLLEDLDESTTLLISTHNLAEAAALTAEAAVLDRGRLAAFGPWARLASDADPQAAYFRALEGLRP
jgi:ABC-2 type transport system ATP-binding protein